ncbi:MAG: hypothetical protein GX594_06715, partial [Pirellulaceae bacterium]|nr:hypothetical protein [Pirellulaceae bacterium]
EGDRHNAASLATSHQPLATTPSPLSPLPSPLFTVRTPTAVVTDLGTEFGVEVEENGETISHVFIGLIKVRAVSDKRPEAGGDDRVVRLGAGETVRVETSGDNGQPRIVARERFDAASKFVRRIYEPPKVLDLLDIVAGGDGTGRRREHGIDPVTGKQDTWFVDGQRTDNHAYHRVDWHPFVDGVFIPYVPTSRPPQPQEVQLDSAGHEYDDFLKGRPTEKHPNLHCTLHGDTVGGIWARAADAESATRSGWIYALTNAEQFMPEGRGLLGIHANAGLTFDLAAIRDKHEGAYPVRLHGTVGMGDGPRAYPDSFGMADLWIFVDGKLKWVRKNITAKDGPIAVDVSLGPNDRFLTLVSTNGQHGKSYDWMVVGDPVLDMSSTEAENKSAK